MVSGGMPVDLQDPLLPKILQQRFLAVNNVYRVICDDLCRMVTQGARYVKKR